MKNKLFTLAAALTLAAVLGGVYAAPALAQVIKAALIKNVDEHARKYLSFEFNSNDTYLVPDGKTLVIEWISVNSMPATSTYLLEFEGSVGGPSTAHRWTAYFPGPGNVFVPVHLHAKAGQTIKHRVIGTAGGQLYAQGYLLDEN
jgi:hypothetical protein